MKQLIFLIMILIAFVSCKESNTSGKEGVTYTCPMAEDSVFSDKPGKCPKCGMELVEMEHKQYTCPMPQDSVFSDKPGKCPKCGMELVEQKKEQYTCPMPQDSVFSDKPGKCPKCGTELVKTGNNGQEEETLALQALLKPTNEFVVASMPVITIRSDKKDVSMEAYGVIDYDTRQIGNISARISGRIERLYVRYKYQKVIKGQKVMDIYSPELLAGQENLLFLIKNDPSNEVMIQAARQKLLLLGMTPSQLNSIIAKGKPDYAVTIYSGYTGHIHEGGMAGAPMEKGAGAMGNTGAAPPALMGNSSNSVELALKEGMYVQKGQTIFSLYDPGRAWVSLSIFAEDASLVKKGQVVHVIPEVQPEKAFTGTIGFIEPFFRPGSKTLTTRVYFENSHHLPIGSQVKAEIHTGSLSGDWLPQSAILSLGLTKVVFKKVAGGFIVHNIKTGKEVDGYVKILDGLSPADSIAQNAQYLMDSESFIRYTKNN